MKPCADDILLKFVSNITPETADNRQVLRNWQPQINNSEGLLVINMWDAQINWRHQTPAPKPVTHRGVVFELLEILPLKS